VPREPLEPKGQRVRPARQAQLALPVLMARLAQLDPRGQPVPQVRMAPLGLPVPLAPMALTVLVEL